MLERSPTPEASPRNRAHLVYEREPNSSRSAEQLEGRSPGASDVVDRAAVAIMPVPIGTPIRNGRLHLTRLLHLLPATRSLAVVVGFRSVCWLGAPDAEAPSLGPHAYWSQARLDSRGRLVLGRRERAWLAVDDPTAFEAVLMPLPPRGLLVVPVEDYARRIEALTL